MLIAKMVAQPKECMYTARISREGRQERRKACPKRVYETTVCEELVDGHPTCGQIQGIYPRPEISSRDQQLVHLKPSSRKPQKAQSFDIAGEERPCDLLVTDKIDQAFAKTRRRVRVISAG